MWGMQLNNRPGWLYRLGFIAVCLSGGAGAPLVQALDERLDVFAKLDLEYTRFYQSAVLPQQESSIWSSALELELAWQWNGDRDKLIFMPFARLDSQDDARSHADIRELLWTHTDEAFDWRLGVGKTFWGATEFFHLVDTINQTDWVESVTGDAKLGQPMLAAGYQGYYNRLDIWVLPGFRERTFPGRDGRLQFSPVFDRHTTLYASARGQNHVDLALRWALSVNSVDLGVSWFSGTRRDPLLVEKLVQNPSTSDPQLVSFYDQQRQLSMDLQWAPGNWLLKFEGLRAEGDNADTFGTTAGVEYSLVGFAGTRMDLGLVVEHLHYSRGWQSVNYFHRAVALGARLTLNDSAGSSLLLGHIDSRAEDGAVWTLEYRQRLTPRWSIFMEGVAVTDIGAESALYGLRRDDHFRITLRRFF